MSIELTPLRENFPKLNEKEIVKSISDNSISGLWLNDRDHNKAEVAIKDDWNDQEISDLIDEFDSRRNSRYYMWYRSQ